MNNKQPIQIDFALVCDDMRREDNGKLILIGVYGYDIAVAEFPANIILTVVIGFKVTGPTEAAFELQVLHERKQIARGRGQFGVSASAILGFGGTLLKDISGPGEIEFQIKLPDQEWQTIKKIPIVLASAPSRPS